MNGIQLSLSDQDRDYLVQLLESALKNHRVEEHRTRAPTYREQIIEEETVITRLLTQLGHAPKT